MFQRLGLCLLFLGFVLVACDSPPAIVDPPGLPPSQVTEAPFTGQDEIIAIVIDSVTPLRSGESGSDNQTEFRLLVLGTDAEGHGDGIICPIGDAIVLTPGQTVSHPCLTMLAFDTRVVGEEFGLVIVGMDEDEVNWLGRLGSSIGLGALAKGLVDGVKGAATVGSAAGGPFIWAGELAIETAVGFVGGEVMERFEREDLIGQQGLLLRRETGWAADRSVELLTQDGGMRVAFHIVRLRSAALAAAVAALPAPEGDLQVMPGPQPTPRPTPRPTPPPTLRPPAVAPPTPLPQFIDRLALVDPARGEVMTLHDGATVDLSRVGTALLDVRAEVYSSQVGSVVFLLDGRSFCPHDRCAENSPPYYMNGDQGGEPYGDWDWSGLIGRDHTIGAFACTHANGEGVCGPVMEVRVSVQR